jgi:uncharacterized protein
MLSLIQTKRTQLAELCRRHHVRRLDVFGSAVRKDFDPASSDLDLLVEFEPLAPAQYAEAYFSFKEAVEALFGHPVDLITSSSVVNPYFLESLAASRELLYAA